MFTPKRAGSARLICEHLFAAGLFEGAKLQLEILILSRYARVAGQRGLCLSALLLDTRLTHGESENIISRMVLENGKPRFLWTSVYCPQSSR